MSDVTKRMSNAIIKVIGVGGGGGNAINTMIESGLEGVEFIAANTDIQALQSNKAPLKIQLGRELTKGLGAGANPGVGHDAALEDKAIIQEVIGEADMVFVTAGMGGGTGTGAAPVIAQVAREMGALTVGVVTKPFMFEGKKRKNFSEVGIQQLRASVDTLITIPNQRLLAIAPPSMSMLEGFRLADDVLLNAVKGISEIINIPGRINVDFADVKTVMSEMGMALMGTGIASGTNRATEAAQAAISSPLLEDVDIEGATGLLINITGPENMSLHEISIASSLIQEAAHEDANIILGAAIDPSLHDELRVTVIATGFDQAYVAPPEKIPGMVSRSQIIQAPVSFPTARTTPPERPVQGMGRYEQRVSQEQEGLGRAEAEELMRLTLQMAGSDSIKESARSAHSQTAGMESMRTYQSEPVPETIIRNQHASENEGPRIDLRHESASEDSRHIGHSGESRSGAFAGAAANTDQVNSEGERTSPRPEHGAEPSRIQHGHAAAGAQPGIDSLTQKALRIAQEFAEDEDFDKPAFLRRREADKPFG
jgi:cell division protein FtsZ